MTAPNIGDLSDISYYFFFEGVTYHFYVESRGGRVRFVKKPPASIYGRLKTELLLAFSVFGMYGDKGWIERDFNPVFEDE